MGRILTEALNKFPELYRDVEQAWIHYETILTATCHLWEISDGEFLIEKLPADQQREFEIIHDLLYHRMPKMSIAEASVLLDLSVPFLQSFTSKYPKTIWPKRVPMKEGLIVKNHIQNLQTSFVATILYIAWRGYGQFRKDLGFDSELKILSL